MKACRRTSRIDAPQSRHAASGRASVGAGGRLRAALRALMLALALCVAGSALAQQAVDAAPLQFRDNAEERRFHVLVAELRCVMCQNQSLADSNAQIAVDLRREVLALMREGRSDAEIRSHLVDRYGEFVLYRPRLTPSTWLLWFGPGVIVLLGGWVVLRMTRRSGSTGAPPEPDDTQEW